MRHAVTLWFYFPWESGLAREGGAEQSPGRLHSGATGGGEGVSACGGKWERTRWCQWRQGWHPGGELLTTTE